MDATCEQCGKGFEANSPRARTCGATCRKRASRRPKLQAVPAPRPVKTAAAVEPLRPPPAPEPVAWQSPLVDATRKELEAAGRLDTALGQQAMRLAQRMLSEFDTGSALAALSKELRSVMVAALADAAPVADALDELAERRDRKASGA